MGAPDNACRGMTPGHGLDPLNNGDSDPSDVPVQLTLDPPAGSNVAPGQTVTVSLDVKDPEKTFRGFIIQARDVADRETQVGSFAFEGSSVSHMTCGKGIHNSITHRDSTDKSGIKATWTAPDNFDGSIFFKFSFAIDYSEYYTNLELPSMRVTR